MIYIVIALVIGLVTMLVLAHKPVIRLLAEKKAKPRMEEILFDEHGQSKTDVLNEIHQLTNNRLSDDLVLDYFFKIKGLQVVNINQPTNFWVKTYLTTPTKVKLNYFEQVKFYETFLNYPKMNEEDNKANGKKGINIEEKIKRQFVSKLIPQKLA